MRFSKWYFPLWIFLEVSGNPLLMVNDPRVWYCSNSVLKQTAEAALSNSSISKNVDEIQSHLESSLMPYFTENQGKWLVSVNKFHRVSGFLKWYFPLWILLEVSGNPLLMVNDPRVWYCSNSVLKQTAEAALSNSSISKNVDEIQSHLESSLMPYFTENQGKWLVSVNKFHRVSGYADATAATLKTFCAINDSVLNIHVVIVKVE
ncbi:hypothetical protein OESDEN_10994 [Oesophagostomum dentatum]|uniref:Uncharacterized protein n=1 Tax=Oesophagostomum dentatum TaxID=61180 RepID=A0A0B1T0B2_OESDE|nr:hypothetical protein OESDEN_10994 [Oesophagostomum dentatum]